MNFEASLQSGDQTDVVHTNDDENDEEEDEDDGCPCSILSPKKSILTLLSERHLLIFNSDNRITCFPHQRLFSPYILFV